MLYRSLLVSSVNSVIGGVIRSSKDFVALRKPIRRRCRPYAHIIHVHTLGTWVLQNYATSKPWKKNKSVVLYDFVVASPILASRSILTYRYQYMYISYMPSLAPARPASRLPPLSRSYKELLGRHAVKHCRLQAP